MKLYCIASYPKVFQAYTNDFGNSVYSIAGLVKEGDPQIEAFLAEIEKVKANAFPKGFKGKEKQVFKPATKQPGYMMVNLTCPADKPPYVRDMQGAPVGPNDLFAGSMVYLDVNPYAYQAHGGGITVGWNAVFCTGEEGPLGRLGGKPSVEALMGDLPTAPQMANVAPVVAAPQLSPALAAAGHTIDTMLAAGWTIETMKEHGHIV